MKQYINKSAVVAEIERRKQDAINNCGGFKSMREHECDSCIVWQYEEMIDIINTLEVKEMDSTDTFINKACEFLSKSSNYNEGFIYPSHSGVIDAFVNNFKNYMKGE